MTSYSSRKTTRSMSHVPYDVKKMRKLIIRNTVKTCFSMKFEMINHEKGHISNTC